MKLDKQVIGDALCLHVLSEAPPGGLTSAEIAERINALTLEQRKEILYRYLEFGKSEDRGE